MPPRVRFAGTGDGKAATVGVGPAAVDVLTDRDAVEHAANVSVEASMANADQKVSPRVLAISCVLAAGHGGREPGPARLSRAG